jgi:hypothetical protein
MTTEGDWKKMRAWRDPLIAKLCHAINEFSQEILADDSVSDHERYRRLYGHIQRADHIISDCFDDWRRSTLGTRILALYRWQLLSDDQFESLSEDFQGMIGILDPKRRNLQATFRRNLKPRRRRR